MLLKTGVLKKIKNKKAGLVNLILLHLANVMPNPFSQPNLRE